MVLGPGPERRAKDLMDEGRTQDQGQRDQGQARYTEVETPLATGNDGPYRRTAPVTTISSITVVHHPRTLVFAASIEAMNECDSNRTQISGKSTKRCSPGDSALIVDSLALNSNTSGGTQAGHAGGGVSESCGWASRCSASTGRRPALSRSSRSMPIAFQVVRSATTAAHVSV